MNWQHLMYFRKIAETQNFTHAAKEFYTTASTLSKAMSSLEDELGFPLFIRSGRNSVLTEYGKIFKQYVDQAFGCIETGIREIRSQMDGQSGSFSICGIYTLCFDYLPQMVKKFLAIYPNIHITMEQHFSVDVLQRVRDGINDLGFCADYQFDDKQYAGIEHKLIGRREMVIVTSKDHAWANRSEVSVAELKQEQFILSSNPKTVNRILFLDMCKRNQFTPDIAFEIPDDQTIFGMLEANLGIACMVDLPSVHKQQLHVLRISDSEEYQTFYMVWKKDPYMSPASRLFMEYVQAVTDENSCI